MIQTVKDLQGVKIVARDGAIGSIDDVYFDDERWAVQRRGACRVRARAGEERPGIEADRPVSRQYEAAHAAYFGYSPYWTGPFLWGRVAVPLAAIEEVDSHLRSCKEVIGYAVQARGGPIGKVEDFVVDELKWAIRDLVVDTRVWWPEGHVHVPPDQVERIDRASARCTCA